MSIGVTLKNLEKLKEYLAHEVTGFQEKYVLKEELGRGSFSIVYRTIKKDGSQSFATKVIDRKKLDKSQLELIEIEINIMKKLNHEHVVKLFDYYDTPNVVYLVLELVTGGELFDRIVELHSYTEKSASKVIKQVLLAIQHLHENNVVHRDLKPENLLLASEDADAIVKLADFGLSSFCKPGEKLTKGVGTPGYIAPEVLQTLDGDRDGYGFEVDLYSVGVILYILLCGFPPFYAEDDDELFDLVIAGKYEYPPKYWNKISKDAKNLIDKLLIVDPTKRLTPKQCLEHPWITENNLEDHLGDALVELKKLIAKKKWKKGINTVIAMGKFKNLYLGEKN